LDLRQNGFAHVGVFNTLHDALAIDQNNDSVGGESWGLPPLGYFGGLTYTGYLDDDSVEEVSILIDGVKGRSESVGQRTANTSVGQAYGVAIVAGDQTLINVYVAKVVDEQGQSLALRAGQQLVY
jgi:hypothetical protein